MYQHISQYYHQIFPLNEKLLDIIKQHTHHNQKAVDLGCGTGRIAHLIQNNGMHVIGVDLDHHMIEEAKKQFPNTEFIAKDMVDFLKTNQDYHLMICVGNTLPHLNAHEIDLFFQRVKKRLNIQGTMIVQLLNYDLILRTKPKELKPIILQDLKFYRSYQYHEDCIDFLINLETNTGTYQESNRLYPYEKKDIEDLLDKHRFMYQFLDENGAPILNINHSHYTIIIKHQT